MPTLMGPRKILTIDAQVHAYQRNHPGHLSDGVTDNALRLGLSANIVRAGASEGVMRIAPPLTATEAEIDLGLELLDTALEQTLGKARHVPEARMFLAKNCCPKIKGGQS
jgi:hypothetical protein